MEIVIPTTPLGVLTLLAFFAPYAIAVINKPAWPARVKKWVAILVPILLALLVLVVYYISTGDVVPAWPVLLLLAVVVCQASYALVTKSTAKHVETYTSGTPLV